VAAFVADGPDGPDELRPQREGVDACEQLREVEGIGEKRFEALRAAVVP